MKKTILILVTILLSSCAPKLLQKQTMYYGYDFRPYTEKGFMFTTEGYNGDYESIASFSVVMFPELKEVPSKKSFSGTEIGYDKINASEVIDSMYTQASQMGANAIIRFSTKPVDKYEGTLRVEGIEVFGFAIKRKK